MKKKGNIYIITDTHFGHTEMTTVFNKRPKDFTKKIFKNLFSLKEEDTLIHLWDFCIWNDLEYANKFRKIKCKTKILVKWNHDKKSDEWYMREAGFSYVVLSMLKKINWIEIYFTHKPSILKVWDVNIHWHTHWNWYTHEKNRKKREEDRDNSYTKEFRYIKDYHIEFALENEWYRAHTIKSFFKKKKLI